MRRLRRVAGWALGAASGLVLLPSLLLAGAGLREDPCPAHAAVVLGARVRPDGRPSQRLRDRLTRGLELWRAGTVSHVLVSGGLGVEGHDEATVMAAWLAERGVPPERILVDSRGNTTWDTAKNARALLAERGLSSVVVVTTYYHLPRTDLAFRRCGLPPAGRARARLRPGLRDLYAIPRELVALGWYHLRS